MSTLINPFKVLNRDYSRGYYNSIIPIEGYMQGSNEGVRYTGGPKICDVRVYLRVRPLQGLGFYDPINPAP